MKKTLFVKSLSFILALITVFCFTACAKPDHSNAPTAKVVLFIGDGMGINQVKNTELYYGEELYFSSFEYQTWVDTTSLTGTTDSAAAATAMATGERVYNEYIGVKDGEDLKNITELAKENKYGTGVVTSDNVTGATPAGFSAHASSRNNAAQILLSQRYSNLDLLLGAGDYSIYESKFEDEGFTFVTEFKKLKLRNKRYFATFENVAYENGSNTSPTLTELATYSVKYMEKQHSTGYFLMIEGAKIDKASHSNDIDAMLKNAWDFSNAIREVDKILAKSGDDYSIIVTADHETGALALANSKEEISFELYGSTNHTPVNVPFYFKSTLDSTPEIINKELILNTDIFFLCKYLLAIN